MGKDIKTNFFLNFIYTLSGVLFPLITFPYASRVMGPEGIGVINFQLSFINYLALFAGMGIPMYGVREIARVREDKEKLRKTTQELLVISFLLTMTAYVIVGVLAFAVPKLHQNQEVFWTLSLIVGFTSLGCEWFYQGVEEFRYIALRGITIRALSLVLLFTLVKTPEDLFYYALYTSFATVGNNALNFFHLRSYGIFSSFSWQELLPRKHLKYIFRLFLLSLITTIYLNLAQMMLGLLQDATAVGYFSAAQKLVNIVLAVIASLGMVTLPRLSYLIEKGETGQFYALVQRAADAILLISLPITIGVALLSSFLIFLFCGKSFEPSVVTLQILSPCIIFVSLSNLFGIQILYPLGKEKLVLYSTLVGVVVNILLNLLLFEKYSHRGVGVAVLFTEISVVCTQLFLGYRYLRIHWVSRNTMITIFSAIVMGGVCWLLIPYLGTWALWVVPAAGATIYTALLLFFKHETAIILWTTIQSKWLRRT